MLDTWWFGFPWKLQVQSRVTREYWKISFDCRGIKSSLQVEETRQLLSCMFVALVSGVTGHPFSAQRPERALRNGPCASSGL